MSLILNEQFEWKQCQLRNTQEKFKRACEQIIILNRHMETVLKRYYDARERLDRRFRYKLRLRLAVIEGVRNMYYEYANRKASDIVVMRHDLFGEIVHIVTDEDAFLTDAEDDDEDENEDDEDFEEDGEMEMETDNNGLSSL